MQNFTNENSQKNGQSTKTEPEKIQEAEVKEIKNYLNKLSENCEKVSENSVKKIMDFARSYRVLKTKGPHYVEVHLN